MTPLFLLMTMPNFGARINVDSGSSFEPFVLQICYKCEHDFVAEQRGDEYDDHHQD
jgi:hypothetical protein